MATGLGIDLGAQWIKVVQVRCSGTSVTVTGALKMPRAAHGPDLPPDMQGAVVVPPNLGQEFARAGLKRSGTLGITGREVLLKYVASPPLPPEKLKMIIDMQVADRLVPGARKGEGEGPAVTHDWRILNVPTGLKGDLVIMAGLAKNEYLFGTHGALKAAGVAVKRMTPSAFGLVQAYLKTQKLPENETIVLVDVGHETLEVAILEGESIYFARSGPGGGKSFDTALDKLLKLDHEKIQEFKHHRAKILPEGAKAGSPQELQFQKALQESADVIANAIRSSIMFCRTQAKLPKLDYQRVFLSGGGARLNGLREYLEAKVKRPVQVLDLYTGLDLRKLDAQSAKCFEGDVPDMTVALGLAVIDAQPRCFHFNLLPEPIVRRRIFWNKTVWAAAAGVVLMLGLIGPRSASLAAMQEAEAAKEDFDGRVTTAKKKKKDFVERVQKAGERTQQIEYQARQSRLGPVCLEFFTQLREYTPAGMILTAVGPADDNQQAQDAFENPPRLYEVKGIVDSDQIKDLNAALDELFKHLDEVPGVVRPNRDLGFPEETGTPGHKGFRFTVPLESPSKPIMPEKKTAAPPDKKVEPAPAAAPAVQKTAPAEPAPKTEPASEGKTK